MLEFDVIGAGGGAIALADPRVIIAGYTGRNAESVQRHIDELAAIGVAPPPRVPMYYPVPLSLVTQDASIPETSELTSGEVEPVYLRCAGRWYLGVGSDHTDRVLERDDIHESKLACGKPIGRTVVAMANLEEFDIDPIAASSSRDGERYQAGALDGLLQPREVVRGLLDAEDVGDGDLICFGGTIPVLDAGFSSGRTWTVELALPDGRSLRHEYTMAHEEEER